jgi:glycosyltransferase involved in cell wall biosynthesis
MIYFVREIMPLLKRDSAGEAPWTLDIVGQSPLPVVQALACGEIRVTGIVPDVRPFIREAMIYVVPLRVGGGSRLKILEAFAMGIPVVSTSVGCEGLGARPGEQLLIADTPADFAQAVRQLAWDPALRATLARNALRHVQAHFGWKAIGNRLIDLYAEQIHPERSPMAVDTLVSPDLKSGYW